MPCDLTDAEAVRARRADDAMEAFGRIDILVNVAGGSGPIGKTGVETTPEEFDDIVTLNMNGCFHTMRGVLPAMMAQRYGKIVNVGGTFGMRGRAGRMAYSASKWGLRGITKSFALEVGALQHQRQLRRARHGRRPALPRQGLRRHGEAARHHGRGGRGAPRRRLRAQARHRPTTTSPMPACSWRATSRARSPASTCRSTAAGRCCEGSDDHDHRRSRHPRRQGGVARLPSSRPASRSRTASSSRSATRRRCRRRARRSTPPGCTCCPARSTCTCISAIPAIRTRKTWQTGTAAAAFGGVTTVFDMPNTIPPTGTAEVLAAKHAHRRRQGACRLRPLRPARRGHHRARAGADRGRRDRLQALHGQHLRQHALALDRRDAGSASRSWRRPASASRCMPRPTRSWSGARRGCARPAASTRSRISRRGRRSSRSRR